MSTITKERVAQFIKNPLDNGLTRGEQMELARIALASLEAEPVAWIIEGGNNDTPRHISTKKEYAEAYPDREVTPLYTTPPAPVSVPDAYIRDERGRMMLNGRPEPRIGYGGGWNAFRAAMLQGAENAEPRCTIQTAPVLDSSPKNAEQRCGNSPVIPGCSCRNCRPITMTDMRFVVCPDCGNKRCPHANDHRNACTGSNEPGQEGSAYPAAPQQEA